MATARRKGSTPARVRSTAPSPTVPVRTCVGCRVRAPATGLLRVAVVDGVLTPDLRRRLPGRGAWLHPDPGCLSRAERRSAFPRALRVRVPLDADAVRRHLEPTPRYEVRSYPDTESQVDPS